jgi:hypothetical protein
MNQFVCGTAQQARQAIFPLNHPNDVLVCKLCSSEAFKDSLVPWELSRRVLVVEQWCRSGCSSSQELLHFMDWTCRFEWKKFQCFSTQLSLDPALLMWLEVLSHIWVGRPKAIYLLISRLRFSPCAFHSSMIVTSYKQVVGSCFLPLQHQFCRCLWLLCLFNVQAEKK